MPSEPQVKRACFFFDGQNLFNVAKDLYGYKHPNYDPLALAKKLCKEQGWNLGSIWFYTGIPPNLGDKRRAFWQNKLRHLKAHGVHTYSRDTRNGNEKGIDLRLALDMVRLARQNSYDVGVIFSQDQDLSEAVDEIKMIARENGRWVRIYSVYPINSVPNFNSRGINDTQWVKIDRAFYDECLDPHDHRVKRKV